MIKRLRTNPLATAIVLASVATPLQSFGAALEEVVVTAQKRAQDMQDVPIAVTAMNADMIKKAGITGVEGIAARTPGFSMGEFNPTQPQLYIRGIGSNGDGAASGEQSVAMFIDGVYINRSAGTATELFDVQGIEVLRGPQGTLWGKNAIGGAINITTKKPSDTLEVGIETKFGNYGLKNYRGMITGPITDNLNGKISLNKKERDAYVGSAIDSDTEFGDVDTQSARAQFLYTPTDNLEMLLTMNYGTDRRSGVASISDTTVGISGATIQEAIADGVPAADFYENYSDYDGYSDMDSQGASLQIDWDLPYATLTSLTAYHESKAAFDQNGLQIAGDITMNYGAFAVSPTLPAFFAGAEFFNNMKENSEVFSQELRLAGDSDNLNWQTGVYYSEENVHRIEGNVLHGPALIAAGGVFDPLTYGHNEASADQRNTTTSMAVFGEATYSVTPKLDVALGLRYTEETKEYRNHGTLTSLTDPTAEVYVNKFDAEKTWRSPTYKLVVNYQLLDDTMIYASAATGFKSGGFSYGTPSAPATDEPFNEENALNMEVGFKSMLLDNQLRLNGAIFQTKYEDLQVLQQFPCDTCPVPPLVTKNAGKAVSQGVELEATYAITDNFQLSGTYAYLDTEYTELAGDLSIDEGNALRNAPRNAYTLVASYEKDLAFGGYLNARMEYIHKEKAFQDTSNFDYAAIPEYRLYNMRLAYTTADEKWEIAGWVNNALDEEYYAHNFQLPPFGAVHVPAMPRTYGVTVTWSNF